MNLVTSNEGIDDRPSHLFGAATTGSPGHELLIHYWQPIALVDELSTDNPSMKVQLFGETFIVRRDQRGEHHFEDDHTTTAPGTLGPPARTYPCQNRNGLVFAYIGDADIPSLPDFDCYMAPEEHALAQSGSSPQPWMEALEAELVRQARPHDDRSVRLEIERTSSGLRLISEWRDQAGLQGVRITNMMFPNAVVSPVDADLAVAIWFVPSDDRNHRWFALFYSFEQQINASRISDFKPSLNTFQIDSLVTSLRLLIVDNMIAATNGDSPLFTVDAVRRALFRGPAAIDVVGCKENSDLSWEDAELSRRSRSPWASFINRNFRWVTPVHELRS